jgi:peptidoglycan/LPS O-acetylase OafA/YrhL
MGSTNCAANYRPDIDGLRAVAVMTVVLYHAWPKWLMGGFVGVDIFFVISGFLISSIILHQLRENTFSIADFYARRVRRIFPALLLVMACTILFGWYVLLPDEFVQLGKHTLAGAGFTSNFVLWSESGYFDGPGTTKPLLHLWSLGIEEQFYIVWPLILAASAQCRARFILISSVIFLISMGANLWFVQDHPIAAFFSPLTRFWELMAGGVAAWLVINKVDVKLPRAAWSVAGALLLLAAFSLINTQSMFPGLWALLPVGGTFCLLLAGGGAPVNRVLAARPLVIVGLMSYPLYLWHWPLLSYAYILLGEKPDAAVKGGLLLAALLLAALTYRFVELPIRHRRTRGRATRRLATGMGLAALCGIAVMVRLVPERIETNGAGIYLAALNDAEFPSPTMGPFTYDGIMFQRIQTKARDVTVFLGDSVVQQYGPRIAAQLARDPSRFNSVIFATAGGCPPLRHTVRLPKLRFPMCPQTVAAAYRLASTPEVKKVVIGAAWYGYFNPAQRELVYDDGAVRADFPSSRAQELALMSLEQSIAQLRTLGKDVYLVLQPPAGAEFDPRSMYTGSRLDELRPRLHIKPFDIVAFNARVRAQRSRLVAIAAKTGARIIDPSKAMCSAVICPVVAADGAPLYTDSIHMRPVYTRKVAHFLDQTITASATQR